MFVVIFIRAIILLLCIPCSIVRQISNEADKSVIGRNRKDGLQTKQIRHTSNETDKIDIK